MYTLSSPTVLATDAACHPSAPELLSTLGDVFRLTETGVTHLGLCALDADPVPTALAWGVAELMDAATPSASRVLEAVTRNGPPAAATIARARLGDVGGVARLVAADAARWPDAPRVVIAGGSRVAASAAAAAGAVCAWWTWPDLPAHHAAVLAGPWRAMRTHEGVVAAPAAALYGPRGGEVVELLGAVSCGRVSLDGLARVEWVAGAWATSMHRAAWAAYTSGRLLAQLRAVIDVTAAFVGAYGGTDLVQLRTALHPLHALVAAAVVGDVLAPADLADLRFGADAR